MCLLKISFGIQVIDIVYTIEALLFNSIKIPDQKAGFIKWLLQESAIYFAFCPILIFKMLPMFVCLFSGGGMRAFLLKT